MSYTEPISCPRCHEPVPDADVTVAELSAELEAKSAELEAVKQRVEELETEVEVLLSEGWASAPDPGDGPFIASKRRTIFHRPDCEWARYISSWDSVEFRSHSEAVGAGLKPCKTCRS